MCGRGLAASVDDEVGLGHLHEGDGRLGQREKEWLRVWGKLLGSPEHEGVLGPGAW